MGDDEQGLASLMDSLEESIDKGCSCLRIESAGRLVEQDEGLIAGDGERCEQAAALAAGEVAGVLSERRVNAIWKRGDDFAELGVCECFMHILSGAFRPVSLEILADGAGEQHTALGQGGDGLMDGGGGKAGIGLSF